MLDKKYRKKNGKAARVIFCKDFILLFGIAFLLLGIFNLFVEIILAVVFLALAAFEFFRFNKRGEAIDLLRDFGPLLVNHPEYSVGDLAKGVRRDKEAVVNEIQFMLKKKVIFGTFDSGENKFTVDDDFNLRLLLQQKGWANALFV